jgi:hypothetical protein
LGFIQKKDELVDGQTRHLVDQNAATYTYLRDITSLGGFYVEQLSDSYLSLFDTIKCVRYFLDVYTLMRVQNFHLFNALSYEEEKDKLAICDLGRSEWEIQTHLSTL